MIDGAAGIMVRLAVVSGMLAIALGIGCSDVERRRVLTFFFEGVPPIEGGVHRSVVVVNTGELPAGGATGRPDTPAAAQRRGSRHPPARDCIKCHASSFQQYQRELIAAVPELCYMCHANFATPGARLHGPVAVGECVICHNPHQSGYVHLQAAPQPDLCYRCHVAEDMATIPGHTRMEDTICTDCHDPHAGEREKLLKYAVSPDPNTFD